MSLAVSNRAATMWGGRNKNERRDRDEEHVRSPFKCHEPGHRPKANGPRVKWFVLAPMLERGAEYPTCCGQVMELLPSDVADKMKPPRVTKKKRSSEQESLDEEEVSA